MVLTITDLFNFEQIALKSNKTWQESGNKKSSCGLTVLQSCGLYNRHNTQCYLLWIGFENCNIHLSEQDDCKTFRPNNRRTIFCVVQSVLEPELFWSRRIREYIPSIVILLYISWKMILLNHGIMQNVAYSDRRRGI